MNRRQVEVEDSGAYLVSTPRGPTQAARPSHGEIAGIVRTLKRGKSCEFQAVSTAGGAGGSYTISLSIRAKPTEAQRAELAFIDAPIVCLLTYGLGGASERRIEVDWLNGTLLQVPSGGFKIEASYPAIAGAKDYDFELSSIIMPATRPPSAGTVPMARRTIRVPSIAPAGSSAPILVPQRGHTGMLLLPDALYYGNVQLAWSQAQDQPFAANLTTRTRPSGSGEQPIPNGANSVVLSNVGPSAIAPVLVFGLAL